MAMFQGELIEKLWGDKGFAVFFDVESAWPLNKARFFYRRPSTNMLQLSRFFRKKLAAVVGGVDRDISFIGEMTLGILRAKSLVISEIARVLGLEACTLHKRLQRAHNRWEGGDFEIDLQEAAWSLVKTCYRGTKYVPIVMDYSSIRGRFGVGMVKPEEKGGRPTEGFDLLAFGVPIKERCVVVYHEIHTQHDPEALCTSKNEMITDAVEKASCGAKVERNRLIYIADRGFANENILRRLNELGIKYIIRVRLDVTVSERVEKSRKKKQLIRELARDLRDREARSYLAYYKGKVPIRLVLHYNSQYGEPIAFATSPELDLSPYQVLWFYEKRVSIEETFRDLKHQHLHIETMRLRNFDRVEFVVALLILICNLLLEFGLALLRSRDWKIKKLRAIFSVISIACYRIITMTYSFEISFIQNK